MLITRAKTRTLERQRILVRRTFRMVRCGSIEPVDSVCCEAHTVILWRAEDGVWTVMVPSGVAASAPRHERRERARNTRHGQTKEPKDQGRLLYLGMDVKAVRTRSRLFACTGCSCGMLHDSGLGNFESQGEHEFRCRAAWWE